MEPKKLSGFLKVPLSNMRLSLQNQVKTSLIGTILLSNLPPLKPLHAQVPTSNPGTSSLCSIIPGAWQGAQVPES